MDVICDYAATTRNDTVSFSYIEMKQESLESLLESQIRKISFDTNRIINAVIHCSHWFSMIAYLKKISFALILFMKQRKLANLKECFFIINDSLRNQRMDIIATKHFTTSN